MTKIKIGNRQNIYLRGRPRNYGTFTWDDHDEAELKSHNQRQCEAHIADLEKYMKGKRWPSFEIRPENVPHTFHPNVSPNRSLVGSHF